MLLEKFTIETNCYVSSIDIGTTDFRRVHVNRESIVVVDFVKVKVEL